MRIRSPGLTRLAALSAFAALSACESSTAAGTGTVRLHLATTGAADMVGAAVQAGFGPETQVSVTFSKAELMPGHEEIVLAYPGPYKLIVDGEAVLDVVDGVKELLGVGPVTPGMYQQLRLIVAAAVVEGIQGNNGERLVPGGEQTGVKVNFGGPVALGAGETVDVEAVISLDESFVFQGPPRKPKGVLFKPVIHAAVTSTGP